MAEFREILIRAYKRLNGSLVCSHLRTIKVVPKKSPKRSYIKKTVDPNQLMFDLHEPLNNNNMNDSPKEVKNCTEIIEDLKKLKKENPNNFEFGSKARRYLDNLKIGIQFDWGYQPKW